MGYNIFVSLKCSKNNNRKIRIGDVILYASLIELIWDFITCICARPNTKHISSFYIIFITRRLQPSKFISFIKPALKLYPRNTFPIVKELIFQSSYSILLLINYQQKAFPNNVPNSFICSCTLNEYHATYICNIRIRLYIFCNAAEACCKRGISNKFHRKHVL